jgi:cytochrome c-type biogenesis protein
MPYIHRLHPELIRFTDTFAVRWYGLSYLAGFVLGYLLLKRYARKGMFHLTVEQLQDCLTAFCIFGGLYLLDWLPLPQLGHGLPQPANRGPWTALLLGLVFGLALGPCAFAWIAPVLGVAGMQAAQGLVLPLVLLVLFALGHLAGVLLAAGSLSLVQRWLDSLGSNRGLALGRAACGVLLLVVAGVLIDSA